MYRRSLAIASWCLACFQSVEYPQWVISIQRTKSTATILTDLTPLLSSTPFLKTSLSVGCALSLWYFGCLCLAHSDHPPMLIFSKCIAPYRCDTVKVSFLYLIPETSTNITMGNRKYPVRRALRPRCHPANQSQWYWRCRGNG